MLGRRLGREVRGGEEARGCGGMGVRGWGNLSRGWADHAGSVANSGLQRSIMAGEKSHVNCVVSHGDGLSKTYHGGRRVTFSPRGHTGFIHAIERDPHD